MAALRDIVVHLDDPEALTLFLPAVVQLARDLRIGTLTLTAVGFVEAPLTAASMTLSLLEARQRDAEDLLDLMKRRAMEAALGLRLEWRSKATPRPANPLPDWSVRGDLLVLRAPAVEAGPLGRLDVADLILTAGRPVLIVPRTAARFRFDRVLIGFKPTREGRLALTAAVPLLGAARRVLLAAFGAAATTEQLADAAAYLAGHGIKAETVLRDDEDDRGAGQALLKLAQADQSDLLVTGAYGHSRASERVFGGVTRTLLSEPRLPWLVAH